MKCAVAKCGNSNKKAASECSLFTFPVAPELRKKWIQFCRQSKDFNFKTCYICMEHFASEDFQNNLEFKMGFAKKRILKRGVVPSIYKPDDKNAERFQRVQRRQNKKVVSELLRQCDDSASQEAEFIADEAIEDAGKETDPLKVFEGYEEICALEVNRLSDAPALNVSVANRCSSVEVMKDLEAKLKMLQNENLSLREENGKLESKVTALKRCHYLKKKKKAYILDEMKKCIWRAENDSKNMADESKGITKGQIENSKNDIKRSPWSERDVAISIVLVAPGAKSFKLMYKKGLLLPGVRTLQTKDI